MNILFLTMNPFKSIDMHNIYSDLMKVFIAHGHRPYIVTPREKQSGEKSELLEFHDHAILKVRIGNTSNVSFIEKGISTLLLEEQFKRKISKYLGNEHFDLILYSTPPITLAGCVKAFKTKYNAKTYLMLKDIFPQNAVDIGLMPGDGFRFRVSSFKSWVGMAKYQLYRYFRRKEKKLYTLSDRIGCMSPANVAYVLKHNPEIPREKVEILPNAIIPNPIVDRSDAKQRVRRQFNVPDRAITLLFGGNLGKPQGIPFVVECLRAVKERSEFFFIVCGNGSEYHLLEEYKEREKPSNMALVNFLPKKEYDELARGCDVGLLFLDHRFTIPNYPSRILSYMENATPVICATDPNTDVWKMVEENSFGFACESNSTEAFVKCLEAMIKSDIDKMGEKARDTCEQLFSVEECYQKIMSSFR